MANPEREYRFGLPNNWSAFTLTNFDLVRGHIVDLRKLEVLLEDYDTENMILNTNRCSIQCRTVGNEIAYVLKVHDTDIKYTITDATSLNQAVSAIFSQVVKASDLEAQILLANVVFPLVNPTEFASHLILTKDSDFVRDEYMIDFRDVTIVITVDVGIKVNRIEPNSEPERIRIINLGCADGNVETFRNYAQAFEFITGLHRITDETVTSLNYDL